MGLRSTRRPEANILSSYPPGPLEAIARLPRGPEFVGTLAATTQAPAAIAQVMKNAVQGSRVVGAARIAGTQTRSAKRLTIAAAAFAATRGEIDSSTPMPAAICPTPVR